MDEIPEQWCALTGSTKIESTNTLEPSLYGDIKAVMKSLKTQSHGNWSIK